METATRTVLAEMANPFVIPKVFFRAFGTDATVLLAMALEYQRGNGNDHFYESRESWLEELRWTRGRFKRAATTLGDILETGPYGYFKVNMVTLAERLVVEFDS